MTLFGFFFVRFFLSSYTTILVNGIETDNVLTDFSNHYKKIYVELGRTRGGWRR